MAAGPYSSSPLGSFDDYQQNRESGSAQQRDLMEYSRLQASGHSIDPRNFAVGNYDQKAGQYSRGAQAMGQRGPAGILNGAQIAAGPQGQMRSGQQQLIEALQWQAAGGAGSMAQRQLQRATDANIAQQMSVAASMRGGPQAGAVRMLANQGAATQQQAAGDSALMALQEQQQAQNQLGQLLTGVRGQDMQLASGQAQLDQQTGMANQTAAFQQQQQNDQMVQYYLTMGFNLDQAQTAANQAYEAAMAQRYGFDQKLAVQSQANNVQMAGAAMNAGSAVASGFAAMSDERLKEDVKPGGEKLDAFLEALGSHDYRYKDEKHGKGRRVSVMAQELEKTELGKSFVRETPEGKAVDYAAGFGTMLAGLARLHRRQRVLEQRKGK